ncbi:metabolite traffic protein EboE [Streptomyces scabiei]|uniref:metabolite traffic protein EboE n=1 Tax=Streptomyces scabiei TaxID=1930 RepID=UPI001B30FA3A|nr:MULTISPECIES: metabolite traffic protein EboE [Streptomyces]MBP5860217.1 sugar phosphate isomerase/epimerase [Streptomyces sp. LBUM 1484]MBP5879439.1 sugar phosphate isomerase/epimerase [Streptomyces sp. LBUM 1477]MBP5887274.1 sugar phosphate isomerase/epimerase [Streptomyces sp. LBUM 1487]MBP5903269.1 sugar phosphate isomerase/epimerase [Streptomyces sp. LBUM 1488]MDW8476897.1 metabolite traffic protein EboE [Streptomyces scabiei]
MRLRHPDGTTVHLGYCSNVHQAEDVDGVLAQLADHAEPVRERLGADRLGIGLWLARDVVSELVAVPGEVKNLRGELAARGLETITLNAFPYAGFHREVVKKDVYLPDWADEARLAHTLDCARVLAALLPDDAERGSVSTLPLAWRTPWPPDRADTARRALDRLTAGLAAIESDTGRRIRVGFEPEPGCVVETTAQAVRELRGLDPERLGVCLDACHLAVQFEEPGAALRRLADAGLPVVKLQASCAVEAADPADPAAHAALRRLAEPRFLHQTRTAARQESPDVRGVDDLPEALEGGLPTDTGPWRVHFHAPLHADPEPPLRTTADQLSRVLAGLLGGASAHCDHIEVETYTWSVLPEPPTDLPGGIAAELAWARDRLTGLGLEEDQK